MRDKIVELIRWTGIALIVTAGLLVVGIVGIEIDRVLDRLPEWMIALSPMLSLAFWAAIAWLRGVL